MTPLGVVFAVGLCVTLALWSYAIVQGVRLMRARTNLALSRPRVIDAHTALVQSAGVCCWHFPGGMTAGCECNSESDL